MKTITFNENIWQLMSITHLNKIYDALRLSAFMLGETKNAKENKACMRLLKPMLLASPTPPVASGDERETDEDLAKGLVEQLWRLKVGTTHEAYQDEVCKLIAQAFARVRADTQNQFAPASALASCQPELTGLPAADGALSAQCGGVPSLENRITNIEDWITKWETYDSGWNKQTTTAKPKPANAEPMKSVAVIASDIVKNWASFLDQEIQYLIDDKEWEDLEDRIAKAIASVTAKGE